MGQRLCDLTQAAFDAFQALSIAGVDTLAAHFPHPAKGASPPGRAVAGRLVPRRANERYTSEPATLAHLGWQAYHRHPGSYAPFAPSCLNSLTPDAHRAGPLHPIAASAPVLALCLLSCLHCLADPLADLTQTRSLYVGASCTGVVCSKTTGLTYCNVECNRTGL